MFVGLVHSAPTSSVLSSRNLPEVPGIKAAVVDIHAEPIVTESASCHIILIIRDWVFPNAIRASRLDFKIPWVDVQCL